MKRPIPNKPSIYQSSSPMELSTPDNPILILKVDTGEENPQLIKLYHPNEIPLLSQSFAVDNQLDADSVKKIESALLEAYSNLAQKNNTAGKPVLSKKDLKSSPRLASTATESELSPRKLAQGYSRYARPDSIEGMRLSAVKPANYGERMYIKGSARKEDSM